MYEVKQLHCLNDSQRGFIVSTDGRWLLYVRQCRVYAEFANCAYTSHSALTSRNKRKMANVIADNMTRLYRQD